MNKNRIDFKGLLANYKDLILNNPMALISAILMFVAGYLSEQWIDLLPDYLKWLPAIGGFIMAAGFCVLVLLIIAPLCKYVIFPFIVLILQALAVIIQELIQTFSGEMKGK